MQLLDLIIIDTFSKQKEEYVPLSVLMERLFLHHQIAKKEVAMNHLTKEQIYTISVMRKEGYSQKAIAESIDKDKSVISRELKRNKDQRSGE
jgi:DNA-binding MarR family transcriptional regulator